MHVCSSSDQVANGSTPGATDALMGAMQNNIANSFWKESSGGISGVVASLLDQGQRLSKAAQAAIKDQVIDKDNADFPENHCYFG